MCSKTKVFFFPYVCLVSFSRPALLQGGQIRPVLCVYWSPWQPFLEIHNKVSLHRKNLILFFSIRNRSVSLIIDTNSYILLSKMRYFNWMEKIKFCLAVKCSFSILVFGLNVIYTVIDIGCPIRKRM